MNPEDRISKWGDVIDKWGNVLVPGPLYDSEQRRKAILLIKPKLLLAHSSV